MLAFAMPIETISNLKNSPSTVLASVQNNPLMLLQNSKPAAILVSPELWNQLLFRLQIYERHELIYKRKVEAQTAKDMSLDEFMENRD